jgi:bacterioferritin (cytochrome b1)
MQQNDKKTKIDDARYYELNNKIQLIIVVASIIMLIGGFLGYNSIDSIKLEIQDNLDEYIDKLNSYDTIIDKYNILIPTLENERDTTFKSLIKTKIESEKIKSSLV